MREAVVMGDLKFLYNAVFQISQNSIVFKRKLKSYKVNQSNHLTVVARNGINRYHRLIHEGRNAARQIFLHLRESISNGFLTARLRKQSFSNLCDCRATELTYLRKDLSRYEKKEIMTLQTYDALPFSKLSTLLQHKYME